MLEAADWTCSSCESKEKTLHVHHRIYIRGRKPWEYEASDLLVLCEDCHGVHHETKEAWDRLFANLDRNFTGGGVEEAMAVIAVWFTLECQEFPLPDAEHIIRRGLGDGDIEALTEVVSKRFQ